MPIEENSTVKASNYLKRYQIAIEADSIQCVGSYVFLWGQKQERTPTWYGVFLEDGKSTESVDVMHFLWSGNWPENRTPQIEAFTINGKTAYENVIVKTNEECMVNLKITDIENDTLNYHWEILPESTDLKDGGDFEHRPEAVEFTIITESEGALKFNAPSQKGNYRLFGYVDDGHNHAATANIPFKVQ